MPRSALVTGSSSGIGRAIALRLAADGFWVLLADVRRDPLTGGEPTDDLIRGSGGACEFARADVSSRQDCDQLAGHAVASTGQLDVLVNNAALAGRHSKPLLDTEDEDFDAIMAVNIRGPFMLCRAAVRQMLTQPARGDARGRIVNITSQHGMVGAPGSRGLRRQQGGAGAADPPDRGRARARWHHLQQRRPGQDRHRHARRPEPEREIGAYVRSRTPFARFGEPRDVAAAVSFLASDDASYVSGATLMVDGGWMAY